MNVAPAQWLRSHPVPSGSCRGRRKGDRARVFEYDASTESLVLIAQHGAETEAASLRIPLKDSPYAREVRERYQEWIGRARRYDPAEAWGPDPFAPQVGKHPDAPWAVAPLSWNGDFCGQLSADNSVTSRAISDESLEHLALFAALASESLARARAEDARALDVLGRFAGSDEPRMTIISRMLSFLVSQQGLGFPVAAFFEQASPGAGMGYVRGLRRTALRGGRGRTPTLERLLESASRNTDVELDDRLAGFVLDPDDSIVQGALSTASFVPSTETTQPDGPLATDLASRLGCTGVLIAGEPLDTDQAGLFVVGLDGSESREGNRRLGGFRLRAFELLKEWANHTRRREAHDLEMLGLVTRGLAHELLQPVQTLLSTAEAISREVDRGSLDAVKVRADRIARNARRIGRTVHALRQLLRPSAGQELLDPAELLHALSIVCQQRDRDQNIDFEVEAPAGEMMVRADPGLLTLALLNLIANAENAVKEAHTLGARVWLTAHVRGDYVRLGVDDNGPGFSAAVLEEIHRTGYHYTSRPHHGLGLGLQCVHRFAAEHRGRLTIGARAGGGASVILRLPAAWRAGPDGVSLQR